MSQVSQDAAPGAALGTETDAFLLSRPDGSDDDAPEEGLQSVGFLQLFRFADCSDKVLMFVGTVAAASLGAALPGGCQMFGDLLDDLAKGSHAVSRTALGLTLIGCFAFVTGWIAVTCFSISGDRQTHTLRREFFSAMMRQEVAMFDLVKAGELPNRLSSDVQVEGPGSASRCGLLGGFSRPCSPRATTARSKHA